MGAFMKERRLRLCTCVLVGSLVLMGYAGVSLEGVSGHFQHIWQAPAQKDISALEDAQPAFTNAGLAESRQTVKTLAEALEGACDHYSLFAIASPATVAVEDGPGKTARLEAISADSYALRPLDLLSGRLIYPEEFDQGQRVALVDEQLAVALFQYAEPIQREILIADESYTIVGIVRDAKRVGDQEEYGLYVPFRAIERSSLPLTALCLEASPIPGSGGWAAFSTAAASQIGEGTSINLSKEKMNAALPARMLGVALGYTLLFQALSFVNARAKAFAKTYREQLTDQYAAKLMPWAVGQGALLAICYGVLVVVFAQLFVWLVAPVYTFPEWVPAILVEPKDIAAAFWNVWQSMADIVQFRSPEVIRVSYFARLMAWGAGAAALAAGILWGRVSGGRKDS